MKKKAALYPSFNPCSACVSNLYLRTTCKSKGPNNGIGEDYITQLAAKHQALLVSIEHRFYGNSLPSGGLKRENLPFLTSYQALQDAASLIDKVRADGYTCSKWIAFGGSYSGALSAWFRIKFSTRVHAALSSSGVVNAILDFVGFDEQVAEAVGDDCANDIRRTTEAFDNAINQGEGLTNFGTLLPFGRKGRDINGLKADWGERYGENLSSEKPEKSCRQEKKTYASKVRWHSHSMVDGNAHQIKTAFLLLISRRPNPFANTGQLAMANKLLNARPGLPAGDLAYVLADSAAMAGTCYKAKTTKTDTVLCKTVKITTIAFTTLLLANGIVAFSFLNPLLCS